MTTKTKEQLQTELDEWKKHASDVETLNTELNQVIRDLKVNLLETQRRESTIKTEKENLQRILKDQKRKIEDIELQFIHSGIDLDELHDLNKELLILYKAKRKEARNNKKKAKKYKRMYKDARNANFELQRMLEN